MKVVDVPEGKDQVLALLAQAQSEPLLIRLDDRDAGVLLSASDYERMRDLQHGDFWALSRRISEQAQANGLTEAKLAALLDEIDAGNRI